MYYKTNSSYLEVREAFWRSILEKDPPTNMTIWKNIKNMKQKEYVSPTGTVRTKEKITVVKLYVENNAKNLGCRHNEVGLLAVG